MQNVVRPTLVAVATKFGLGAEIQSPTGLLIEVVCSHISWKVLVDGFGRGKSVKLELKRSLQVLEFILYKIKCIIRIGLYETHFLIVMLNSC